MTPEQIAAALELARESRTYVVLGGPMLNRLADAVQALAAELAAKDAEIARLGEVIDEQDKALEFTGEV